MSVSKGRGRGAGLNVDALAKFGVKATPPSGRGSNLKLAGSKVPAIAVRSESQGHKLVREFAPKLHEADDTITIHRGPQEQLGTEWGDDLRLQNLIVGDSPARRAGLGRFINRRLTHVNDVAVSTPSDILIAAQNAATMALRFEAQRSASRTESSSRGASPTPTPSVMRAAALRVNQAPKTIELLYNDEAAKVKLSSDPSEDLKRQAELFGVHQAFVLVDEFGNEVKPTDLHNGRQYTLKALSPSPSPADDVFRVDETQTPSPGSPGSGRRSRLSELLDKIAPPEDDVNTEPPKSPETPEQVTEPVPDHDVDMSDANNTITNARLPDVAQTEPQTAYPDTPLLVAASAAELIQRTPAATEQEEERQSDNGDRSAASTPKVSPKVTPKVTPKSSPKASTRSSPSASARSSPKVGVSESPKASLKGSPVASAQSSPSAAPEPTATVHRVDTMQFSDVSADEDPLPTSAPKIRRKKEAQPVQALRTAPQSRRVSEPAVQPRPAASAPRPTPRHTAPAHAVVMSDTDLWKEFNARLAEQRCDYEMEQSKEELTLLCEVKLTFTQVEASRLVRLIQEMKGKTAQEPVGVASPSSLSIAGGEVNGRRDLIDPGTALYSQVESVVMSSLICSSTSSVQVFRVRQLIPGARICGQYNAAKQSLRPELRQKKVLYYAGPRMPTLSEITNEALFGEMRRNGCLVFSTEAYIPPSAASSTTKMKLLLCELLMGSIATPSQPTHVGKTGPVTDFSGARKLLLNEQGRAVSAGMPPPDTLAIDYPYLSEESEEGQVATEYVTTDAARVLPRFVVYLEVKSKGKGRGSVGRARSIPKQLRSISKSKKHNETYREKRLQEAVTMKHFYKREAERAGDIKAEAMHTVMEQLRVLQEKLDAKRAELLASVDNIMSQADHNRRENLSQLEHYIDSLHAFRDSPSTRPPAAPHLHETPTRMGLNTAQLVSALDALTLQQE